MTHSNQDASYPGKSFTIIAERVIGPARPPVEHFSAAFVASAKFILLSPPHADRARYVARLNAASVEKPAPPALPAIQDWENEGGALPYSPGTPKISADRLRRRNPPPAGAVCSSAPTADVALGHA